MILNFLMIFYGCLYNEPKKEDDVKIEQKIEITLEKVISDFKEISKRADTEILTGIYIFKKELNTYYSMDYLSNMTQNNKIELIAEIMSNME